MVTIVSPWGRSFLAILVEHILRCLRNLQSNLQYWDGLPVDDITQINDNFCSTMQQQYLLACNVT